MTRCQRFLWTSLVLSGCSGRAIDVGPGKPEGGTPGGAVSTHAGSAGVEAGASGSYNGDSDSAGSGGSAAVGGFARAGAGGAAGATDYCEGHDSGCKCSVDQPLPTWPTSAGCVAASNLPLVGRWHGYVEQQGAPYDDLSLVIVGASIQGGVCGTLTIGAGKPPPPATDPNIGYPGVNDGIDTDRFGDPVIAAGFALTLLHGTTDGNRVRFTVAKTESLRSWCQIQRSYAGLEEAPVCGCLPPRSGPGVGGNCMFTDASGNNFVAINCGKLGICRGPEQLCACNSAGCDANVEAAPIDWDLRFTDTNGEGSNSQQKAVRAHFERVP